MTRQRLQVERLETRNAPAQLFHFTDKDGDSVTVSFSKGQRSDFDNVFTFSSPGFLDPKYIQEIDLTKAPNPQHLAGMNIAISVGRGPTGDGFTYVGWINAPGIDLGNVSIHGDLGKIVCGDGVSKTDALKSLNVQSLGRFATNTGAPDNVCTIDGKFDNLVVRGDIDGAFVQVIDSGGGHRGSIGTVNIGGSVIGGVTNAAGAITTTDSMGPVKIAHDIVGGAAQYTGYVASLGTLAKITLGGSLIGAGGPDSGEIYSKMPMGAVKIFGDLNGGPASLSGLIDAGSIGITSSIASIFIGGSLVGNAALTGFIGGFNSNINIGPVTIGGSIIGNGFKSGRIFAGTLSSVTIGGSLIGGSNNVSGGIQSASDMGPVKIGGDIIGGAALEAGEIRSAGNMGFVSVGGDIKGGGGDHSGTVEADRALAGITVGGSLLGGAADDSGEITSASNMGLVKIRGNVTGGDGTNSGRVNSNGKLAGVTAGGSIEGGSKAHSGEIFSMGDLGAIIIAHDLQGGGGVTTGRIESASKLAGVSIGGSLIGHRAQSGEIRSAGDIGAVTIGGDVEMTASQAGGIFGGEKIASIAIKGSVTGVGDDAVAPMISAQGKLNPASQADSVTIGKLTVGGNVEFAWIAVGYKDGMATNPDASIGNVQVRGDWIASSLVAGIKDGGDGYFGVLGATDDTVIPGGIASIRATISSISIDGQLVGTPTDNSDSHAFAAEAIASMKIGGATVALPGAHNNFNFTDPSLSDVTVEEL